MFVEILESQLSDIFRAGLIFGLIYTMLRTRATTGTVVPLLAGVVLMVVMFLGFVMLRFLIVCIVVVMVFLCVMMFVRIW